MVLISDRNKSSLYEKFSDFFGSSRVLSNEPLSKYVSLKIGGPADLLVKIGSREELVKTILEAVKLKIPYFVLGGGTNLLVSDKGFRGLVIKNETGRISLVGIKGSNKKNKSDTVDIFLNVDSGVSVNRLVRYTLDQGLSGLEYFLGQPGTVGGAVWINAHNVNKSKYFGDLLYKADILDSKNIVRQVEKSYFDFGYDESIIQKTEEIVLSVVLKLTKGNKTNLWEYAHQSLERRKTTQPQGVYSCGCIFRNIKKSDALRLATPNYTQSAGYIVDSIGLKGIKVGGAEFSPYHANFIIHKGQARASDMIELIELAQKKAKENYNIELIEEIVKVGDF